MSMAVRLAALFPRAVVVVLVWVLATAAFTFAADNTIIGPSTRTPATPAQAPILTVPPVGGQAYVFVKGILEDAGFAWRVAGTVHGYASNTVIAQSPAAGTRVIDTGAPTVVLRLVRGPYGEHGKFIDTSSYRGTRIRLADVATSIVPLVPRAKPKQKPVVKPKQKPVVKPKQKPVVKPRVPVHKPAAPEKRPPAFRVAGAPREPLDEITLAARASRLAAWIRSNPKRTSANVQRWLYQHAWIVTGAGFGWSHGAQALETLIDVDRRVEKIWGVGHRSEGVARVALARVRRAAR
jgi:PASTA domain-containing protein